MPCGYSTGNKDEAVKVASQYLECSKFASIAHTNAGYKVYPRVGKKEKPQFIACVKGKGVPLNGDWAKE